ncbi:MAG: fluoride efflux transporter CrcB [Gammaproteobacteria bacterium]
MSGTFIGQVLLVGAGGFIGSALRFIVSSWAQRSALIAGFPLGTLVVNVIGCLLIGVLSGLAEQRQLLEPGQRLFLSVGILGGFTTFSTFAFETVSLLQEADVARAIINVLLQVTLGCIAALLGFISVAR